MHKIINATSLDTDDIIIKKILAGERLLFQVLMRRNNPVMYKIARSHGFNHQDAEDIMQEAHLSAYLALEKFRHTSSYRTWISKITINKCLNKLKYSYQKSERPVEEINESLQPVHMQRREDDPETLAVKRELATFLEKSLEHIPMTLRVVFVLREIDGFSVAETAEMMHISPVNVRVRLNRAKSLLQKQLAQFYSVTDLYSFNLVYCDDIVESVVDKIKGIDKLVNSP